jgi:L-xylulose reductase
LGTTVVAVTLTQDEADALKKEHGDKVVPVVVNLADWDETETKLKPYCTDLDFLCNVAGVTYVDILENIPKAAIESIFNVNAKAPLLITGLVARHMKERRRGTIVNVSSISSLMASDGHVPYCASKAAVDMLTKCGAKEFGPYNIRINAVNPTVVWTEMGKKVWSDPEKQKALRLKIPMDRFVEVREVIDPILFLLGSESSMISGVCLPIDGGMLAC